MNSQIFYAPGRVNLIDEHTDYNGGYVLPCAMKMGTYASITPLGKLPQECVVFFATNRQKIGGFDISFQGDIPSGAGLSSSASIEVVTAVALNTVFSLGLEMLEIVKLAKRAENEFCGVKCGIMD